MVDSAIPPNPVAARWRPAAPLLPLLPALVLPPVLLALPAQVHAGGWELLSRFLQAALRPSTDPLVWRSAVDGLAVTLGMALLGWTGSLVGGLLLGCASSCTLWREVAGQIWPAMVLRRLLALPRSLHELLWGLLLLQLFGLRPVVAVVAIALPYSALVARVLADQLDALPTAKLDALRCAGVPPSAAVLTALGPALLPGLLSYGGYRLECALRSATLLGVFGLGGLGTELRLTLQSLEFRELWCGLWLLLTAMLLLEAGLAVLRRRWLAPRRLRLAQPQGLFARPLTAGGQELVVLAVLLPLACWWVGGALGVHLSDLATLQPLPPLAPPDWATVLALPWAAMISATLVLTLLAGALAVGLAPLLLILVAPWPQAQVLVRFVWALGRLWPPPLTALLLLFVLKPGLLTAALALGFHNLGILGRLLLEALHDAPSGPRQSLGLMGAGPRLSLLYGSFSAIAHPYLAYGAYRTDVILRETVVVGLVGATGLGSQLQESLTAFAWERMLALVAVYATLTLLGEDVADRCRRRLLVGPTVQPLPDP
jgi:phosphonate transport system permease protein